MLAVMAAATPESPSPSVKSPLTTSFSPLPRISAHSNTTTTTKSRNSTPHSPSSSLPPSRNSPQPTLAAPAAPRIAALPASSASAGMTARPQLAIRPLAAASPASSAPSPAPRPLQQKVVAAASPAAVSPTNVMSMNSVVSPMPQSPVATGTSSASSVTATASQSPAASAASAASLTTASKPPMSITSKEWVIPPRPKPGRKPATDTPPTKRKAQNRAAQRAFRERRAARVGELEDQLDDQKAEFDRVQAETQERMRSLETEVQVLRSRCQMLESLLEKEKQANHHRVWTDGAGGAGSGSGTGSGAGAGSKDERYSRHNSSSSQHLASSTSRSNSTSSTSRQHHLAHSHHSHHQHILSPLPQKPLLHGQHARGSTASSSLSSASGRRTSTQAAISISQIISPPDEMEEDVSCASCAVKSGGGCACAEEVLASSVTSALDCGKCSLGTKCVCLEESLKAFSDAERSGDLKRPHPPGSPAFAAPDEKKARHGSGTSHTSSTSGAGGMGSRGHSTSGSSGSYGYKNYSSTEIDFTQMFMRPKASTRTPLPSMPGGQRQQQPQQQQPQQQQQQQQTQQQQPQQQQTSRDMEIPLKDKCGFCSDGTYCVCADTMPGVTMTGSLAIAPTSVIAQQKTPPPSENDGAPFPLEVTATGAIKLSSITAFRRQNKLMSTSTAAGLSQAGPLPPPVISASSCGPGGPGTCAQCLSDPVSGLFCRSLAASFERGTSGASGGCCGGGGPGGCCKSQGQSQGQSQNQSRSGARTEVEEEKARPGGSGSNSGSNSSSNGNLLSLSCADAFKTLSSHRHFDEATDEIGTWLPMLKAVPRHDADKARQPAERHPMEVEAASIMSVLKGFDVRFGK